MTRVVIALLALAGLATAQDGRQPAPPAPKDFAVMAGGSPSDPEQLRGMREAGLEHLGLLPSEDLARFGLPGLTCFVNVPWIGDAHLFQPSAGRPTARSRRRARRRQIGRQPCGARLLPARRTLCSAHARTRQAGLDAARSMPGQWPYVNLFPYRVSPRGLARLITIPMSACW